MKSLAFLANVGIASAEVFIAKVNTKFPDATLGGHAAVQRAAEDTIR